MNILINFPYNKEKEDSLFYYGETIYSEPISSIEDCLEILNTFIKEGYTNL